MFTSHERLKLSYDPFTERRSSFLIPSKNRTYAQQFANVYYLRLSKLRQKLIEAASAKWKGKKVGRVLDVDVGEVCVVVGTIYCEMKMKPNVLEDLAREHYLGPASSLKKWVSKDGQDETVMLEDESGRIRLVVKDRQKWTFVTGTSMAVLGRETSKGDLDVHDIVCAGAPSQPDCSTNPEEQEGWVAIISGLDLDGSEAARLDARCDLLAEWLDGEIGSEEERQLAKRVSRLVIAGNSVRPTSACVDAVKAKVDKKPKRYGYDPSKYTPLPTERLDEVLSDLNLPIDLIPGSNDPTTQALPQQPLHQCLLPKANFSKSDHKLINGPNPWWAKIGGQTFLGTSGQNLDDVYRYVAHEDRLKLAIQMLEWNHIAPTTPDTLWCYPFREEDPFVLTELPRVYFIGNQPRFETELVTFSSSSDCESQKKQTRVILVPRFSKSGIVVLINPATLACQTITLLGDMAKGVGESDGEGDESEIPAEKIVFEMDEVDDDDE
ncbi:hypothetical protein CROQUDRAFT_80673 [Cronartium quercuum f. sp. fusiforme G11]|uniref:DNA-directed DNA polymerase n=1 Tax=Cronartium quercuum f. sp. fusiforme G11 TaxID=708437 RepID=A0A9P6T988_9BASI|nr:hypothetical protein CROQUDRAFT_80673 [Cronartium quercuum f. sp. fusiforme G11]